MCVIIYKPKKAYITRETLSECWDENPDGGGFMYSKNNVLQVHKGFMSFRKFYKQYRKCENDNDSNFVIHFRIATSGLIDSNNSHPFYVNKSLGFVHNGILNCVDVPEKSNRSDTAIFNETVLKKLPKTFLKQKAYHIMLESIARQQCSKFAFMDNKGTCYIFNECAGVWQDGIWFSNQRHKWDSVFPSKKTEKTTTVIIENEKWIECYCCGDFYPVSECVGFGNDLICSVCANECEKDYIFK